MRQEAFDDCYAESAILEEIDLAVALADEAGYASAVSEVFETTEKNGLLGRAKRAISAATAWLF